MKTSSLTLLLTALLLTSAACEKHLLNPTKSRSECGRLPRDSHGIKDHVKDTLPIQIPVRSALFYSAVDFEPGYDWQRDTAYGMVPFSLSLYEDDEKILEIKSRPEISPSPGTHHIIDGHIFTERQGSSGTVICMDGETVVHFHEREILKGLILEGEDVYTLSRDVSGDGFTYRKNGVILMSAGSGTLFGGFDDPSYPQTGALYQSMGGKCFCYKDGGKCFTVCEGDKTEIALTGYGEVLDMKTNSSITEILHSRLGQVTVDKGGLFPRRAGYDVCGIFRESGGPPWSGTIHGSTSLRICSGEAEVFPSQEHAIAVMEADGRVRIWDSSGTILLDEPGRFLSNSCAASEGAEYAVAIAPHGDGDAFILTDKTRNSLNINGYISCVRFSPPTI